MCIYLNPVTQGMHYNATEKGIVAWLYVYVTGPAEWDQVGTKCTISKIGKYLEFYV